MTEHFLQRLQSYYRAAVWTPVDVLCWALGQGEVRRRRGGGGGGWGGGGGEDGRARTVRS